MDIKIGKRIVIGSLFVHVLISRQYARLQQFYSCSVAKDALLLLGAVCCFFMRYLLVLFKCPAIEYIQDDAVWTIKYEVLVYVFDTLLMITMMRESIFYLRYPRGLSLLPKAGTMNNRMKSRTPQKF